MNGLLLDTHILLRAANGSLDSQLLDRLQGEANLFVSSVSLWEIAIKVGLGKLQLDMTIEDLIGDYLSRSGMVIIPISVDEIAAYASLAFPNPNHRDPFDRMLIVQTLSRNLALLTSDLALTVYGTSVEVV